MHRKHKSAKSNLLNFENAVRNISKSIEFLTESIENLKTDDTADSKVKKLNQEMLELKSSKGVSTTLLKELSEREIYKGRCYVCEQTVSDDLYDSLLNAHTCEVDKHKKNQIYCQNKLNELSSSIRKLQQIVDNNKKLETYTSKLKTKGMELEIAQGRRDELIAESERLFANLEGIENNISMNNEVLDSIRNNDFRELHRKIVSSKEKHKRLSDAVERKNR